MALINLLNTTSRVETPFVMVTIGNYVFGVYDKRRGQQGVDAQGFPVYVNKIQYPNYIQSLNITKINGKVNTYSLELKYLVKENDDPNFIEKVLSSVSNTRTIIFSYGDLSLPSFIYKDEEAIITDVQSQFGISDSSITYKITAVSKALQLANIPSLFRERTAKPSDVIKEMLYDNGEYGTALLEIFNGMRDRGFVELTGLIPGDDKVVELMMQENMSILDYLAYLINSMSPLDSNTNTNTKNVIYILTIVDDFSGLYGGQYFKITKVGQGEYSSILETYEVDIGYPTQNIVLSFQVDENQSYSIFNNFAEEITQEHYVQRINDDGEEERVYAPLISSDNKFYLTTEEEKTWWTKVTSYPIQATLTLKGLLRPALLMTHVKLNVYFFGKKHISSGLYIITKQSDIVDFAGFKTTLSLTRVGPDMDI
jgi:hypothetical protein